MFTNALNTAKRIHGSKTFKNMDYKRALNAATLKNNAESHHNK